VFQRVANKTKQTAKAGKPRIGERFEARDFTASHAKAIDHVRAISHARLAQHGWYKAFRHVVKLPDESLQSKRLACRLARAFLCFPLAFAILASDG